MAPKPLRCWILLRLVAWGWLWSPSALRLSVIGYRLSLDLSDSVSGWLSVIGYRLSLSRCRREEEHAVHPHSGVHRVHPAHEVHGRGHWAHLRRRRQERLQQGNAQRDLLPSTLAVHQLFSTQGRRCWGSSMLVCDPESTIYSLLICFYLRQVVTAREKRSARKQRESNLM